MPYIKEDDRKKYDELIDLMKSLDIKADGDLNYILHYYAKYCIIHNYNNIKNFCAELRQSATEIERKILAPYEDKKIIENGDV